MTPAELYARTPVHIARHPLEDIGSFNGYEPDPQSILPEVRWGDRWRDVDVPNVQTRMYADHDNGKHCWRLGSLWLLDRDLAYNLVWHPVMIFQLAGRYGEGHRARWITDPRRYKQMVAYIDAVLFVADYDGDAEQAAQRTTVITDSTADFGNTLTHFHGHALDAPWRPDF